MPNYDFTCSACGHEFEKNVPLDDRDKSVECPSCGKKKSTRGVSAVKLSYLGVKSNLTRAGSGWNDVLNKVKKGSGRSNTIRTR